MAIKLADTARPNNYVDAEHLGTYPVAYAEDVWFEDGTRLSEKTFDGQSIQKEELPLASADELGNIYQYVGETGTYTNGRFYKCILNSSVYSWSEIKMVENPVVYSETIPDINAYETGSIVCYTGEDSGSFEKGHLYKNSETSFNYYYWTFYRDSAKTQPYIFYTQEETLANGVNVYQANPATGEGDISPVGSITNYQEFSFFVSGSSSVQYFHPEADTSKNRTITEGNWIDIGGGGKLDNVFLVKDSNGATTLAISQRTFTGTQAEWDGLTVDEKAKYEIVNITDDTVSDIVTVVDSVTPNDMNPVTSNAVADCTGYIDKMMLVDEAFDTAYQDGSGSREYNITTGLYRVHVYLHNPTSGKTSNRCLIERYENGTARTTLFDFNYTGSGTMQQQNYIRVKSGTISVLHEASGSSVNGRCYFALHKVSESH